MKLFRSQLAVILYLDKDLVKNEEYVKKLLIDAYMEKIKDIKKTPLKKMGKFTNENTLT